MTRKSLREIQDYAARRNWAITITPRMVERRKADLRGADLYRADLSGADLRWANLR